MSQQDIGDYILTPKKVSDVIKQMSLGNEPAETITQEEAEKLLSSPLSKSTENTIKSTLTIGKEFVPRGEGSSGLGKAPEVPSQTKSVYDGEDKDGLEGEVSSVHDPTEYDTDPPQVSVPETSGSQMSVTGELPPNFVTEEKFDNLAEAIQAMINDRFSEFESRVQQSIVTLTSELQALGRQHQVQSTKVNDLAMRINNSMTTKTMSAPVKQSLSASSPPVPSVTHKRTPSVAGPSGAEQQRSIIGTFLEANPAYPKIQVVRRGKLVGLSKSLGFNPPKSEVTPGQWSVDGLLLAFTQ